jgi:glycosyltransferase involved in cell wall biosynthesis
MPQLISVIIPAYNHQDFITQTIQSLQGQGYEPLEVILVDDGSSDGTRQLAQAALEQSGLAHEIHTQVHQGAHAAINHGIARAHGEWISILNSDDRYAPGRLGRLMQVAARRGSRFLVTRVRHIDAEGESLPPDAPHCHYYTETRQAMRKYRTNGFELLRHNYAITTGNFFFQRSLYEQVGPFQPYLVCHDWDFILRALLVEEIFYLDEPLYEYRVHQGNTLRNVSQQVRWQEIDEVISAYILQAEEALNPLAPSKKNYNGYWEGFLAHEVPHLIGQPLIRQAASRYDLEHASPLPQPGRLKNLFTKLENAIRQI